MKHGRGPAKSVLEKGSEASYVPYPRMRLDDCYALLEIRPGATEDEMQRAHRDLTKVWHPDRFANDAALRRKAEEKLKAINEAYETILVSRSTWPAPEARETAPRVARNRVWALTFLGAAIFVLLRRPTPAGLLIALLLFSAAFVFAMRR